MSVSDSACVRAVLLVVLDLRTSSVRPGIVCYRRRSAAEVRAGGRQIFVLANCFVLPMIARYCWYRAKTKVAILQDIKDYVAAWEELQRTEPDALKDLKGEVDKINSAIDQSQVFARTARPPAFPTHFLVSPPFFSPPSLRLPS
eukprot:2968498-Rhodomonas_salina.1